MAEEKLLTVREVSLILGISEKEVIDLAESGAIPAYKVGGVYLRFKREQIEEFKKSSRRQLSDKNITSPTGSLASRDFMSHKYSFKDGISDFFYFNDFYILSILLILLMLILIFQG
jgi:excisionase family DNA binding protein